MNYKLLHCSVKVVETCSRQYTRDSNSSAWGGGGGSHLAPPSGLCFGEKHKYSLLGLQLIVMTTTFRLEQFFGGCSLVQYLLCDCSGPLGYCFFKLLLLLPSCVVVLYCQLCLIYCDQELALQSILYEHVFV